MLLISSGVKNIFCKDESYRFGLNAFKVLGDFMLWVDYIAKELGKDVSELPYNVLSSDKLREEFGQATFFTATDGNHGRGVAWAAIRLGQKAVVRMPRELQKQDLTTLLKKAQLSPLKNAIMTLRKNGCCRSRRNRTRYHCTGAWPGTGYEEIPSWIMQGYGTMVREADQQLKEQGIDRPTHVFVQAGVGSLAGAVVGLFRT